VLLPHSHLYYDTFRPTSAPIERYLDAYDSSGHCQLDGRPAVGNTEHDDDVDDDDTEI